MFITQSPRFLIAGYGLLLGILTIIFFSLSFPFCDMFIFDWRLLIHDILISFSRVTIASIFSWTAGIIGGFWLKKHHKYQIIFMPSINFIRHISPFAWLPFAIIWFGLGEAPIAFILLISLFFPSIVAATDSFKQIKSEIIDDALVSGADNRALFWHIELPLLIPTFISLFRIMWGLGWTTVIAAEMLGVQSGLGFRLLDFRYLLQYPQMFQYLLVMGFIGIIIDYGLRELTSLSEKILFTEKKHSTFSVAK